MRIALLLIPALLAACAVRPPPPPDPAVACYNSITADPELSSLAPKVGGLISPSGVTIETRSNQSRPTDSEKSLIGKWDAERQRCFSMGASHRKQYLNPQVVMLGDELNLNVSQLIAKLYQGSLTYGEFVIEREKSNAAFTARYETARQQYNQEQAMQAAQRQAASDAMALQLLNQGRPGPSMGTSIPGSTMMRPLRNQWQAGPNRMCQYSDGSVINMGIGLCPLTLN